MPRQAGLFGGTLRFADRISLKIAVCPPNFMDKGFCSLRFGTSTFVWFGSHLGIDASRGRM